MDLGVLYAAAKETIRCAFLQTIICGWKSAVLSKKARGKSPLALIMFVLVDSTSVQSNGRAALQAYIQPFPQGCHPYPLKTIA